MKTESSPSVARTKKSQHISALRFLYSEWCPGPELTGTAKRPKDIRSVMGSSDLKNIKDLKRFFLSMTYTKIASIF